MQPKFEFGTESRQIRQCDTYKRQHELCSVAAPAEIVAFLEAECWTSGSDATAGLVLGVTGSGFLTASVAFAAAGLEARL